MNIEKYTERARGFVQSAQSLAMRDGHQQFSSLHMLKVLLDDSEGLAGGLIDRAGGNSRAILKATEDALKKLPKVSGSGAGQIYLAPDMARASDAAWDTCANALQVFGGIGFTWEHDLQFWLKRSRVAGRMLGSPREHRDRVAELAGLGAGEPAGVA